MIHFRQRLTHIGAGLTRATITTREVKAMASAEIHWGEHGLGSVDGGRTYPYQVSRSGPRWAARYSTIRLGDYGSRVAAQAACQLHHEENGCPMCFTPLRLDIGNPEVRRCSCGWTGYR